MSIKKTLGGDRLGSGKQMKVSLHNFERSNHDLSYVWRSTMAPGTLVPFMSEVGLSGDTFDIMLEADAKTYPTVGPLFGSFKLQLDVFMCPIRLYQAQLHNNKLGIGMNMGAIKLPQLCIQTVDIDTSQHEIIPIDIQQVSPSSIMNYLGISGIGRVFGSKQGDGSLATLSRKKNAVPFLGYWDIYKNYYANKQEEVGYYINMTGEDTGNTLDEATVMKGNTPVKFPTEIAKDNVLIFKGKGITFDNIVLVDRHPPHKLRTLGEVGVLFEAPTEENGVTTFQVKVTIDQVLEILGPNLSGDAIINFAPRLEKFPLENIDLMREDILADIKNKSAFIIDEKTMAPYGSTIRRDGHGYSSIRYTQQGLGIKTYQSDIFNNWLNTEWISGDNGISAVTSVDVSDGKLEVDALYLAKKVYDMLNRIAVSGGSYYDWIEAVYSEKTFNNAETPIYMGGLSKEIVFEEVVSNSEAMGEDGISPLGTLAGRGRLSQKHKGGKVTVRVTEPSYIMGIVSITPRIDYSQGNRWDTRLKTMDDFHKPSLDGIGFQDLITEQMASWESIGENDENEELSSAGKQPAWLNYMTNYNRCHGHFADQRSEMFMTLNRRYEFTHDGDKGESGIKDLTSYIDPSKFNYAFAQTDLSAQNFWIQLGVNLEARRKISSKQIPNL